MGNRRVGYTAPMVSAHHAAWRLGSSRLARVVAILCCVALQGAALRAQEPAEAIAVADVVRELKSELKAKNGDDAEITRHLLLLAKACNGDLDKSDRKRVQTIASAALQKYAVRAPDNVGFYRATTDVLANLGNGGSKELARAYDNTKRYPKYEDAWLPVRTMFLAAMGRTRSKHAVESLCETLVKTDEDGILVACGEALRNFAEAEPTVRKNIAKLLIRRYSDLEVGARAMPPVDRSRHLHDDVERFKRSLQAVRTPWNTTLRALTGAEHTDGEKWDRWWREHKDRRWK